MAGIWPAQSLIEALKEARRVVPDVFEGRSRGQLVRQAWRDALRHNVPPLEFFAYRLANSPGISRDAWIYQWEIVSLLGWLARPEALDLAADKLAFAGFCERTGLRSVPTLGRIGAGVAVAEPVETRIIVKPRSAANARNLFLLSRHETGWRIVSAFGEGSGTRPWRALLDELFGTIREELLMQPELKVHPELAQLASAGSPAARLVTGLRPGGSVELLHASFAVPAAGTIASNGGARRMVDITSGRLMSPGPGRLHDVFGDSSECEVLEGITLPDWTEAVEMARTGHESFPPRAILLGWDIAFTPDGPVLIEVNTGLSFFLEQYETLIPAGTQVAADLVAAWLQ